MDLTAIQKKARDHARIAKKLSQAARLHAQALRHTYEAEVIEENIDLRDNRKVTKVY